MSNIDQINHFVVLMLENRSFDHMLGYLRSADPSFAGLTGAEWNLDNPLEVGSHRTPVSSNAPYVPDLDPSPNHDVRDVTLQIYGTTTPNTGAPPSMSGFIFDYSQITGNPIERARRIMQSHSPESLPVLSALANEFAVCDHWFCSVPGPTWPNRFFVHAATSNGFTDNNPHDYSVPTIFDRLSGGGKDWRIYSHDFAQSLMINSLREFPNKFEDYSAFLRDCQDGKLPPYSFIEPRYFNFLHNRANDQHPPHGVPLGEHLIADVYEAMRKSPKWNASVLIVLWDEHGGMYDHVPPPACVNPDGKISPDFNFLRLGARVPAIIISPLIAKGAVDHKVYDHTSVAATLRLRYGLKSLTKRDAAANTFDQLFTLAVPRTDAPRTLSRPDISKPNAQTLSSSAVHDAKSMGAISNATTSDLQKSLVALARNLNTGEADLTRALTAAMDSSDEHSASIVVQTAMQAFTGN